jgi:hypothetical protein
MAALQGRNRLTIVTGRYYFMHITIVQAKVRHLPPSLPLVSIGIYTSLIILKTICYIGILADSG